MISYAATLSRLTRETAEQVSDLETKLDEEIEAITGFIKPIFFTWKEPLCPTAIDRLIAMYKDGGWNLMITANTSVKNETDLGFHVSLGPA
jgi:hypothetical protein